MVILKAVIRHLPLNLLHKPSDGGSHSLRVYVIRRPSALGRDGIFD